MSRQLFLISMTICLLTVLSQSRGEEPLLVKLCSNPHRSDKTFLENWPRTAGGNLFCDYYKRLHRSSGDVGSDSRIGYRFDRQYFAGERKQRVGVSFEGTVNEPQLGETIAMVYQSVKVREIIPGKDPAIILEVLSDDFAKEVQQKIGKGFVLSVGSALSDSERVVGVSDISPLKESPDKLGVHLRYARGFEEGTVDMDKPLIVGDVISMHVQKLRITTIYASNPETKRRGWIAVEPILPEPMTVDPLRTSF